MSFRTVNRKAIMTPNLRFVYNHIGLGGVLLIDFATYVISFSCYFALRKGRHTVRPEAELAAGAVPAGSSFSRFWLELREGFDYLRGNRYVVLLGASWALFIVA